MSGRAFTLAEVLAAAVILGLLAASAAPLMRHLVAGQERLHATARAVHVLEDLHVDVCVQALEAPVEIDEGLWLHATALVSDALPPPMDGRTEEQRARLQPAEAERLWLRLRLCGSAHPDAATIAARARLFAAEEIARAQREAAEGAP